MLFILGRGRSGTSLVSRVLNQHEAIAVPPEGCFILNCYSRFKEGLLTPKDSRIFVKTMMTENRMKNWNLDTNELVETLENGLPLSFQEACELVIEQWAKIQGSDGATIFADKNPHYSLWAAELGQIFPNSKFIHVVRNPFDNIASFQNVRFDINDAIGLALRWSEFNQTILSADLGDRCFELHYEKLVESPEDSIRSLCFFLGVEFSESLLRSHLSEDRLSPWHENLSKPINTGRVGYGLKQINPKQVKDCNSIVAPVARLLGYEVGETSSRPSLFALFRGKVSLFVESNIYRLPLIIRSQIINRYRRRAGSI